MCRLKIIKDLFKIPFELVHIGVDTLFELNARATFCFANRNDETTNFFFKNFIFLSFFHFNKKFLALKI